MISCSVSWRVASVCCQKQNFFNPRFLIVLILKLSVPSVVLKCMLISSWWKTLALEPTNPNFSTSRPRQPPLIIRTFSILKLTKAERKKNTFSHIHKVGNSPKQKSSNFSSNFSSNAKLPSLKNARVSCSENVSAKLIPVEF